MPESLSVSRRQLLGLATAAYVAWQIGPWPERLTAFAGSPDGTTSDAVTTTLEAFSDTLIPGYAGGASKFPGVLKA